MKSVVLELGLAAARLAWVILPLPPSIGSGWTFLQGFLQLDWQGRLPWALLAACYEILLKQLLSSVIMDPRATSEPASGCCRRLRSGLQASSKQRLMWPDMTAALAATCSSSALRFFLLAKIMFCFFSSLLHPVFTPSLAHLFMSCLV